ncbi:MAG: hypothetical protein IKH88_07120 [Prevotella sp.]|nr:hypothetical protein [Prevotella sp.]
MKKIFTFIAVCLMSLQFATAQEVCFAENIQEQMPEFVGGDLMRETSVRLQPYHP